MRLGLSDWHFTALWLWFVWSESHLAKAIPAWCCLPCQGPSWAEMLWNLWCIGNRKIWTGGQKIRTERLNAAHGLSFFLKVWSEPKSPLKWVIYPSRVHAGCQPTNHPYEPSTSPWGHCSASPWEGYGEGPKSATAGQAYLVCLTMSINCKSQKAVLEASPAKNISLMLFWSKLQFIQVIQIPCQNGVIFFEEQLSNSAPLPGGALREVATSLW